MTPSMLTNSVTTILPIAVLLSNALLSSLRRMGVAGFDTRRETNFTSHSWFSDA
jgi:hypothetical protein